MQTTKEKGRDNLSPKHEASPRAAEHDTSSNVGERHGRTFEGDLQWKLGLHVSSSNQIYILRSPQCSLAACYVRSIIHHYAGKCLVCMSVNCLSCMKIDGEDFPSCIVYRILESSSHFVSHRQSFCLRLLLILNPMHANTSRVVF